MRHGYTTHGHACCEYAGAPVPQAVARCMGPPACPVCRPQVAEIHGDEQAPPQPEPMTPREELRSEIRAALNRASAENPSDTPDFILASYLMACLDAYDAASIARREWFTQHP